MSQFLKVNVVWTYILKNAIKCREPVFIVYHWKPVPAPNNVSTTCAEWSFNLVFTAMDFFFAVRQQLRMLKQIFKKLNVPFLKSEQKFKRIADQTY